MPPHVTFILKFNTENLIKILWCLTSCITLHSLLSYCDAVSVFNELNAPTTRVFLCQRVRRCREICESELNYEHNA